jgi:ribonuclease E
VIADPTVSGQQSFVIDRGEQVHTLEAAKALLATQVAAVPSQTEEAFDDDEELLDAESEVETDETEGLSGELAAGGEAGSETAGEGPRRKRRRRRRGRGGSEARENGAPREESSVAQEAFVPPADAEIGDEDETDDDESGEQPNPARSDQAGGGERRPRRRGRRGGRRRRGGPEDDLAGSISDELGPVPAPEAASAVADFDGVASQPAPVEREAHTVEPPVVQPPAPSVAETEAQAQESDRAARRRSTVREKVSFGVSPQAETTAPDHHQPAPEPAGMHTESAPETTAEAAQPRRAGWWSRRFGGGE